MPAISSDRAHCLLAFDTAGTACSAAVWRGGAIRARRFEIMSRGQSERLVPMIEAVMAEAGIAYPALDAVAVTRGPGGFTGVRIGLATARALALACARPVIGVSNFEAVAAAVPDDERRGRSLAVVIDAKRSDLYVQAFGAVPGAGLEPVTEAQAIAPADLDAILPGGAAVARRRCGRGGARRARNRRPRCIGGRCARPGGRRVGRRAGRRPTATRSRGATARANISAWAGCDLGTASRDRTGGCVKRVGP